MKKLFQIATLLIAAYAIPTGAVAQKIYRCGSSYSQVPCADGVVIDAQDSRSKIQKSQTDAAAKADAATASAMEKERLKQEAQALSANKPDTAKPGQASLGKADGKDEAKTDADGQKKSAAHKKKEPEYFTARVPAEPKKKAASAAQ